MRPKPEGNGGGVNVGQAGDVLELPDEHGGGDDSASPVGSRSQADANGRQFRLSPLFPLVDGRRRHAEPFRYLIRRTLVAQLRERKDLAPRQTDVFHCQTRMESHARYEGVAPLPAALALYI
jgi:hypothetical protein